MKFDITYELEKYYFFEKNNGIPLFPSMLSTELPNRVHIAKDSIVRSYQEFKDMMVGMYCVYSEMVIDTNKLKFPAGKEPSFHIILKTPDFNRKEFVSPFSEVGTDANGLLHWRTLVMSGDPGTCVEIINLSGPSSFTVTYHIGAFDKKSFENVSPAGLVLPKDPRFQQ